MDSNTSQPESRSPATPNQSQSRTFRAGTVLCCAHCGRTPGLHGFNLECFPDPPSRRRMTVAIYPTTQQEYERFKTLRALMQLAEVILIEPKE